MTKYFIDQIMHQYTRKLICSHVTCVHSKWGGSCRYLLLLYSAQLHLPTFTRYAYYLGISYIGARQCRYQSKIWMKISYTYVELWYIQYLEHYWYSTDSVYRPAQNIKDGLDCTNITRLWSLPAFQSSSREKRLWQDFHLSSDLEATSTNYPACQ